VVCDPGVDDFLALLVLAGGGQPPSAVIGTAGNVDANLAVRNAAGIVALLGLDCPVAKGCEGGLRGPYPDTGTPFHGRDGLGGIASALPEVSEPATLSEPVSLVKGAILATGALTVVAMALNAGSSIDEVVWMGGAVACGGNMTATAEFNAWLDPEASDRVLSSDIPLAMVPLDVTHQVRLDSSDFDDMNALGQLGALAARSCSHFHDQGIEVFPHDAVAAVAFLQPELFAWEERWVRCELHGTLTRGMTVVDRRRQGERGSIRVAMAVDVAAVKERIFEAIRSLG
jgi:pyrimidine-specific ribonucleoside hydrolase